MTTHSARPVDRLVAELVSLPAAEATKRIAGDPRLHSIEVVRRLTEQAAVALPDQPEDAARCGAAAMEILHHISNATSEAASVAVRASRCMANACRLRGDLDPAESTLISTLPLLNGWADAALHLREVALLRWEQGRCDEAVGLSSRSVRLFRDADLAPEASATSQLLILFHAEMGEAPDAIALFRRLGPPDPTVRPWLAARASLTAAFCLADHEDLARPEEALAALAQGSSLMPFVRSPEELLQLEWLKARASARMGGSEEAEDTLIALRHRLDPSVSSEALEYHLLTLDLLAVRLATGRETLDLLADLSTLSASLPWLRISIHDFLSASELSGSRDPWGMAGSFGFLLRRACRLYRLPIVRLPFA